MNKQIELKWDQYHCKFPAILALITYVLLLFVIIRSSIGIWIFSYLNLGIFIIIGSIWIIYMIIRYRFMKTFQIELYEIFQEYHLKEANYYKEKIESFNNN